MAWESDRGGDAAGEPSLAEMTRLAIERLSGESRAKGAFAICLGLALGTVGIDGQTGQPRFTFGVPGLLGGMNVVVVTVGLFAVGEVFWYAAARRTAGEARAAVAGPVRMTRE